MALIENTQYYRAKKAWDKQQTRNPKQIELAGLKAKFGIKPNSTMKEREIAQRVIAAARDSLKKNV